MMISIILFSASVTGINPVFEAILRNGQILSNDHFAETEIIENPGKMTVLVPFLDGDSHLIQPQTNAFYTFSSGTLALVVSIDRRSDILRSASSRRTSYWSEFVAYSRVTRTGSFAGTNAFGVRARVSTYNIKTVKIAFDHGNEWKKRVTVSLPIKLNGPEARKLISVAAVELIFYVDRSDANQANCKSNIYEATIDNLNQIDNFECVINSTVESIKIVRTDTGEILAGNILGDRPVP